MVTTNKKQDEKIFIQIDNERIELTGNAKEEFLEMQKLRQEELNKLEKELQLLKELKISAYKKLGLTDEEIGAII